MLTGSQVVQNHTTGILHPAKVASVRTVAKGIHIREEKRPALRMENLAVGAANKTILKLYADQKILPREMTPKLENGTFKTLGITNPAPKYPTILLIHSLLVPLGK